MRQLYSMRLNYSPNGRSSQDEHDITFKFAPKANQAFVRANARELALDVANVLAGVQFNSIQYQRAVISMLNGNGRAIKNETFGRPLAVKGKVAVEENDAMADDRIVLILEKAGPFGNSGQNILRHVVSAMEYAEITIAGVTPARFIVSPAGTYAPGLTIGAALLKAFGDNGFDVMLTPKIRDGELQDRPVELIEAVDFRSYDVTREIVDAGKKIAQGVTSKLRKMAKAIWELAEGFLGGNFPVDVLRTIWDGIADILSIYNALKPDVRVLVKYPSLPSIPALPPGG